MAQSFTFLHKELAAILKGTPTEKDWAAVVAGLPAYAITQQPRGTNIILATLVCCASIRGQIKQIDEQTLQQICTSVGLELEQNGVRVQDLKTNHKNGTPPQVVPDYSRFNDYCRGKIKGLHQKYLMVEEGVSLLLPDSSFALLIEIPPDTRWNNIPRILDIIQKCPACIPTLDLPRLAPHYQTLAKGYHTAAGDKRDRWVEVFLQALAKEYLRYHTQQLPPTHDRR